MRRRWNLSKLVKDPNDFAIFAVLLPLLELGVKDIADPECRGRFEAALAVVKRVGDLGSQGANKVLEKAKVAAKVKAVLNKTANRRPSTTSRTWPRHSSTSCSRRTSG